MRETIKEYLTFSKKERTGILILLSIVLVIAVAPVFYNSKNAGFGDSTALHVFKDQVAVLDATDKYGREADSISASKPGKYRDDETYAYDRKYKDRSPMLKKEVVMADFDPNTISTSGWIQLGV